MPQLRLQLRKQLVLMPRVVELVERWTYPLRPPVMRVKQPSEWQFSVLLTRLPRWLVEFLMGL